MMNKTILFSLILVVLTSSFFSQNDTFKSYTFSAKFENIRLQDKLRKNGKKEGDIVKVSLQALIFNKPIRIDDVRKENNNYGKEINFLINYYKVLISGTNEEILSYWLNKDRNGIKQNLDDKELAKRSQDYISKNPGLKIIGIVKHKDFITVLQDNGELIGITGNPMIQTDGRFYLVQKPNDLDIAIVEASFLK